MIFATLFQPTLRLSSFTSVGRGGFRRNECGATMTRDASQIERDCLAGSIAGARAIVLDNIYFLNSAQSRDVAGSSPMNGEGKGGREGSS